MRAVECLRECGSALGDMTLAYVYDGTLEGLLSAVFLAFQRKEDPQDISPERSFAPRLGQQVIEVPTNIEHAARVKNGIVRVCGADTFSQVVQVSLSDEPDKGSVVLGFVRYAMRRGLQARFDLAVSQVSRFSEIAKSVCNERHLWQQFMRFSKTQEGVYVAVCNPKANVVPLLMDWFSARFNVQPFVVFDEVRHIAGVSRDGHWSLAVADDFTPPPAACDDALYEQAWKAFYDAVAIDARYNPELRSSFMPKRLWKNIVEMKEISQSGSGKEERRSLPKEKRDALCSGARDCACEPMPQALLHSGVAHLVDID